MRAILSVRPNCSHRLRLSEGNPFKTSANPQAHNQKLSRANVYENEISRFKLSRCISYAIDYVAFCLPCTPNVLQINSPPVFFVVFLFVIFTGIRCGRRFFFVTPMCGVFCFFLGGGGWKIFFVNFTKLIPRKICFYCENFGVDGKSNWSNNLNSICNVPTLHLKFLLGVVWVLAATQALAMPCMHL